MKIFHFWLGVLLLYSITACKKEKAVEPATLETTVYGRVVLRGTEQKATNKQVVIKAYKHISDWFGGPSGKLVVETTSDTNGNYSFSFRAESLETRYFLIMQTVIPNHFDPGGSNWIYFKPGQKQELQLRYIPHAWLRLHVRNVNPIFPGEEIRIYLGGGELYKLYGPVNHMFTVGPKGGNGTFIVSSGLRRADTLVINREDTMYLPAFDTTYHLIEY